MLGKFLLVVSDSLQLASQPTVIQARTFYLEEGKFIARKTASTDGNSSNSSTDSKAMAKPSSAVMNAAQSMVQSSSQPANSNSIDRNDSLQVQSSTLNKRAKRSNSQKQQQQQSTIREEEYAEYDEDDYGEEEEDEDEEEDDEGDDYEEEDEISSGSKQKRFNRTVLKEINKLKVFCSLIHQKLVNLESKMRKN